MKFIKRYLSLFLPIFSIAIVFNMYVYTQELLHEYQINVNKNYSIIISSKKELKAHTIRMMVDGINKVEDVDTDKLTRSFSSTLSRENLSMLRKSIPYFYNILLDYFPSSRELSYIEQKLYENKNIIKVETFTNKHTDFTQMVILTKGIINFFIFIVFILSLMLIFKQVEVWYFEHAENMEIMSLFGASLFQKTSRLFVLAVISAVISSIIVSSMFYLAHNNDIMKRHILEMGLYLIDFSLFETLIKSLLASLSASLLIIVSIVVLHKD